MCPLGSGNLCESFLGRNFQSLTIQPSFLNFHPCLETPSKSPKSSTKIFPALAQADASPHGTFLGCRGDGTVPENGPSPTFRGGGGLLSVGPALLWLFPQEPQVSDFM